MNCARCGRVLYVKQTHCACGWKIPQESKPISRMSPPPEVGGKIGRSLGEIQREVDEFIAQYKRENPDTTMREACLVYLGRRGLVDGLPDPVRAALDPEAVAEREAMQAEAEC